MQTDQPISDVVHVLEEKTDEGNAQIGDVLSAFGSASFSSVLLAVAVMLVSPLSGVPLFSSVCGITIFLVASQGALGRKQLWLPERLLKVGIGSNKTKKAFEKLMQAAKWLDERTAARLPALVSPPASRVLFGICAIFGTLMPLLELVPLSSSLVGAAVSLIAAGLLARDGLIAAIGLLILPISTIIPIAAYSAIAG
ncbi:Exopolysaccharide synthesis, ExoD [Flavimaricola marinus]|uniref:Exopolysaccharide synthesis, ExoD n=1 Tax=Flavimaricola marinus TaxID=1819565 RepID=A0A238LNA8_9RHOB|nr:Exopolysaccharide synthesis, ExoD [Flavimaricola marinus]